MTDGRGYAGNIDRLTEPRHRTSGERGIAAIEAVVRVIGGSSKCHARYRNRFRHGFRLTRLSLFHSIVCDGGRQGGCGWTVWTGATSG